MGRQLLPRSTLTPISWFTCLWLAQGSLRIRREPKPVRKIPENPSAWRKSKKQRALFAVEELASEWHSYLKTGRGYRGDFGRRCHFLPGRRPGGCQSCLRNEGAWSPFVVLLKFHLEKGIPYFIFLSDNQPSGLRDGNFSGKFSLVVQNGACSVHCKALRKRR